MKTNHILVVLALLGGISAAFTSHSKHNNLYPDWKTRKDQVNGTRIRIISAHHLADLLYEKNEGLIIFDARSWKEYQEYHIPRALPLDAGVAKKKGVRGTMVIYGGEEDSDLFQKVKELPGRVYLLKGGMEAWYSLVLFPDFSEFKVRNGDRLEYILRRSGFFGGKPQNTQLLNLHVRESRYREGC